MPSVKKQAWQQATALVSLSTCGTMTGFAFAHGTVADMTSPAGMPVHMLALDEPTGPAARETAPGSAQDGALRSAIVGVARYYLGLARTRTPADMEALIWQADSTDGADHGPSCAAFASLTLALGAQAVGQHSWATGGGSYPWPLHPWADVRVQPNPASPTVVSMRQDAQAHHRWHPAGDGYRPQPGDWVLFDGHVEVVTGYTGAALDTVGADSLPDLTVNAHSFPAPLAAQGVLGFVDNGARPRPAGQPAAQQDPGSAAIPGAVASLLGGGTGAGGTAGPHAPAYRGQDQPAAVPGTAVQQAFISLVAPAAISAEQRYGIPAAVTIAQAIDESGWGQSALATADHNLFGIKGTGPAGADMQPTREYENGVWVTRTAPFRVYHNIAESVQDHSQLLARGPAYQRAMASRHQPDAFATALTGVYATDPDYGSKLIALMRLYHLYRYDSATPVGRPAAVPLEPQVAGQQAAVPGVLAPGGTGVPGGVSIPGMAGALAVGGMRARPAGSRRRASYVPQIPGAVTADFVAMAQGPLTRAQPLYQDVAGRTGIDWELLAACDWMQCQAEPRYSPVHGEKLGTVNPDGTVFRTKSAALAQCATELTELADAVYLIGLTVRRALSVRELASVFAAFRWGGLLRAHDISAMEFPYSVAGLTVQHLKMRWPDIDDPNAPDKPGRRFRLPFGAVPVVLSLGYRAAA